MKPKEPLSKVVKNFKFLVYAIVFELILGAIITYKRFIDAADFSKNGIWTIGVSTILFGLTGYILYNLIKLLNAFKKKDTFIQVNSLYLLKISNCFLALALIESFVNNKHNSIQILSNEHYGLSFGLLTALLLCLSLFSRLFSLILQQATEIKEDSDLTI